MKLFLFRFVNIEKIQASGNSKAKFLIHPVGLISPLFAAASSTAVSRCIKSIPEKFESVHEQKNF
jgi:hypothetical protein